MKVQVRAALAVAILALVAAVSGAAGAATVFVTSKQIKNGTILSQDIHKQAVRSTDLQNEGVKAPDIGTGQVTSSEIGNGDVASADIGEGEVHSGDIGANQVTPSDVEAPEPEQLVEADAASGPATTAGFALLDVVGTYAKEDPTSVLEVDWSGSAAAGQFGACLFQLRVDGQPAGASAGQVYLSPGDVTSVSASALFDGLGAGPHQVEVWAMIGANHIGEEFTCTVGPAAAGIGQTFVVSEQVV